MTKISESTPPGWLHFIAHHEDNSIEVVFGTKPEERVKLSTGEAEKARRMLAIAINVLEVGPREAGAKEETDGQKEADNAR